MHKKTQRFVPPPELPERDFTITHGDFAGDLADFEVRFVERVLARNPEHVESLMFLGNTYTARGEHERGLEMDLRLLRLRPLDPIAHYNLACSYALLGQVDRAIDALRRSVRLGYADVAHLEQDSDLDNIRNDPRYKEMLDSLRSAHIQGLRP